jgi:ArsR family transcriptional regulator, lead/cadmium/zinc/bismuth-responsive transcriptional repressor
MIREAVDSVDDALKSLHVVASVRSGLCATRMSLILPLRVVVAGSSPRRPLQVGRGIGNRTNMRTRIATTLASSALPALEHEQIVELAELLRLLGEPTRLRILLACLAEPGPVGEIAARVDIARSLVSHHLRMLRASRFLRATRSGKQIIYSPVDDRVRCILEDLVGHVIEPAADKDED